MLYFKNPFLFLKGGEKYCLSVKSNTRNCSKISKHYTKDACQTFSFGTNLSCCMKEFELYTLKVYISNPCINNHTNSPVLLSYYTTL